MEKAHFGMIGLGTMGRNFLLNIAEHGIGGVGYDLDEGKRKLLLDEGAGMPVDVGNDLADFIAKLETPRNIMMLVPAGPIVDSVIKDLVPYLEKDDLIIDGGNSHFTDTERREADLSAKGIEFMGVGVSGGEEGARHGASIMPGGHKEFYDRIEPVLQAAASILRARRIKSYVSAMICIRPYSIPLCTIFTKCPAEPEPMYATHGSPLTFAETACRTGSIRS